MRSYSSSMKEEINILIQQIIKELEEIDHHTTRAYHFLKQIQIQNEKER